MTIEELQVLNLPVEITDESCIYVESALEWILQNTTYVFNPANVDDVRALPSSVKLFIKHYTDVMNKSIGVTSESLGGMSQSFDTTAIDELLWQYANALIGNRFLKSRVRIVPAKRKW